MTHPSKYHQVSLGENIGDVFRMVEWHDAVLGTMPKLDRALDSFVIQSRFADPQSVVLDDSARSGSFRANPDPAYVAALNVLRHSCPSLAIKAGANIKVLRTLLGHKTATLTSDRCGHLNPDELGVIADALDDGRDGARAAAASLRDPNPFGWSSKIQIGALTTLFSVPRSDSNRHWTDFKSLRSRFSRCQDSGV